MVVPGQMAEPLAPPVLQQVPSVAPQAALQD
jgi:hypothetical protein